MTTAMDQSKSPTRAVLPGALFLLLGGCYAIGAGNPGPADFVPPRIVDPAGVALPPGYRIEVAAKGLTFPVGVTFDADSRPVVVEAGYSYGEVWTTPRLRRVEADGSLTTLVEGGENGPWTGAVFHDGGYFVSQGGGLEGGRLVRHAPGRPPQVLLDDLPTRGDHHTNGPVLGADGFLYLGLGTATNAGIVGPDNHDYGWLRRFPAFRDRPCRDVRLAGADYESRNPLVPDGGRAVTGAFVPFGTPTVPGQIVQGGVPCGGAILRVDPRGGTLELAAWGFRNPFGLAVGVDGSIWVANHEYDDRGSRPVWGTGDTLWRLEPGRWYGWPDFHAGQPLYEGSRYKRPGGDVPRRLLAEHPDMPPTPAAVLGVHAGASGIDMARNDAFGWSGRLFVAEFGDQSPTVGRVMAPVGYRVSMVDPTTGVVTGFAENRARNGPASLVGGNGLERPVSVRFAPDGRSLYIVDFGVMTVTEQGSRPRQDTGVLWRIVRETAP